MKSLFLWECNLDVVGLRAGLQINRCIQELYFIGINRQDTDKLNSLAPFLSRNPSLKYIALERCSIGPVSINILSSALLHHSEDTLKQLILIGNHDLSKNHFGHVDLDGSHDSTQLGVNWRESLRRYSVTETKKKTRFPRLRIPYHCVVEQPNKSHAISLAWLQTFAKASVN